MCVVWGNVAAMGTHTKLYWYIQVHTNPQQRTCELGHEWHAKVGCMGKDSSLPLKVVGCDSPPGCLNVYTSRSPWEQHHPCLIDTTTPMWPNEWTMWDPLVPRPGAASLAAQWVGQNVDCRCSLSMRSTSETSVRSTADGKHSIFLWHEYYELQMQTCADINYNNATWESKIIWRERRLFSTAEFLI
jgi:hypothetical protein